MDMTCEIVEALMKLGSVPPVQYSKLARIAERGVSARDKEIIRACNKSINCKTRALLDQKKHNLRIS